MLFAPRTGRLWQTSSATRNQSLTITDRIAFQQHVIVAKFFASLAELAIENMDQRNRPIQAAADPLEQQHQRIAPPKMSRLMDQHITQFLVRELARQLAREQDRGPKQTAGHWSRHLIGQTHVGKFFAS